MTTSEDIIRSAASVGRDAAEGRLSPADLDQAVADECRALFRQVVGDGDPLWPLHRDVTRQSIALGALSTDELSEWAAVIRRREAADGSAEPDGADVPTAPDSSLSVAHNPDSGDADGQLEAGG